jgi:hypothetical protein
MASKLRGKKENFWVGGVEENNRVNRRMATGYLTKINS